MNIPIIKKILATQQETTDIRTITFSDETPTQPGQFYMIWIPGIDEIPMSVSKIEPHTKSITFRKIGDATTNLFQLIEGELIGVRGPFGNGYHIKGKNILFVGGGTGIAMLAPAIEQAIQKKRKTTVIIGVKTKTELFFIKRLQPHIHQLEISTNDGTHGFKGYASDLANQLIT
ncbi:MAG: dihydroorotate dehydrogenase electron transfer subunit, partial [Candidatus Thermoplasmatota archaeon]|nr:dihydroorotate dehydrogenase electron transfer subunit [Candidatus Thermoplasmatota archaeon]